MSLVTFFATFRNNLRYSCIVQIRNTRNCTTQTQANEEKYEDNIRNNILEASLPFVYQHGWSKEALSAGAQSLGYSGVTHGMFTKGGADLITYFQRTSNAKLNEFLIKYKETDVELVPVQIVEEAVKQRLQMTVPYLPKWAQAVAIMTQPPNMPEALATLLTMVDDICYHAGDRSVDFNWYARRIALAGIYKASELYLMQDVSPEYAETWKFLNRRLKDAMQLQDVITRTDSAGHGAKETISAAFTTARNIIGLNKVA